MSQRGSHMKMQRVGPDGIRETLTIPAHRELDTETCRAILRLASRFIPVSQLTPDLLIGIGSLFLSRNWVIAENSPPLRSHI